MKCEICGKEMISDRGHYMTIGGKATLLCSKHYIQYLKYGHFLDKDPVHHKFDPNDFEVTDDGIWVYTFNRKLQISGKFLIEECDFKRIIVEKWRKWKNRFHTGSKDAVALSRFIMNAKEDEIVDHIDGNPANNKRSNLRLVTMTQNNWNKTTGSNNTSGITGVFYKPSKKRWLAYIHANKIRCVLGHYYNKEDAAYARYCAEKVVYGEYRCNRDKLLVDTANKCKIKDDVLEKVEKKLKDKFPDKF